MAFNQQALEHTRAFLHDSLHHAKLDQLVFDVLWSERENLNGLTTKELGKEAEKRYKEQTSKKTFSEDSVRQKILRLKIHFEKIFTSAKGRRLPCLVGFRDSRPGKRASGHYRLHIEQQGAVSKLFWAPYLSDVPTQIVFSQPQFFRGSANNRFFLRDLDVNNDDPAMLMKKRPQLKGIERLHGVRHYVGRGDVDLMVSLVRWFAEAGVQCETVAHHDRRWTNSRSNLILLGNGRTVPNIPERLSGEQFNFVVTDHGVTNAKPELWESECYDDDFDSCASGIVARYYDTHEERWVTAICSNHTSFYAGVAEELVAENKVAKLLRWLVNDDEAAPMLTRFEMLLRFACGKDESLSGNYAEKLGKRPSGARPARGVKATSSSSTAL